MNTSLKVGIILVVIAYMLYFLDGPLFGTLESLLFWIGIVLVVLGVISSLSNRNNRPKGESKQLS
jgi:membrane protein required for beta-lactamase induction